MEVGPAVCQDGRLFRGRGNTIDAGGWKPIRIVALDFNEAPAVFGRDSKPDLTRAFSVGFFVAHLVSRFTIDVETSYDNLVLGVNNAN